MKATSTHHPHASPHLPHTKAQQVLCNSCPSSQRPIIPEFSVCRKLARAHHSLETLPSQVSVPHSILWELWYFPRAALCLCEVSAFELFLHLPARGAKDTFPLGAPGCKIYSLGLSGIFSSFGSQVLWHLRYCAVIGVPKAKPAEMPLLIPSMERLWWGSILRRNYQCFSKFLKPQLPRSTPDCRLSRLCPVTLWISGLQCWGAVRVGWSLGKGSQEPRLITRHQCISSRACWTHCAVPWPDRKITC